MLISKVCTLISPTGTQKAWILSH
uniref:Uncharacterized protein n=1 Tax=Arundo donax TaxID=35708 RepID=A0A0A9ARN5_ARUDO